MYITTLSVPVSFECASDEQARMIAGHLQHLLTNLSLPHQAEQTDAATVESLIEWLPDALNRDIDAYGTVGGETVPTDTTTGRPCEYCADEQAAQAAIEQKYA